MHRYLAIAFVAIFAGCSTTGNYVAPTEARQVWHAKTSQDVMKTLGAPTITIPSGNGKTTWVYAGVHSTPSIDSFIPLVGAITGRENQICSQLSFVVDDQTGAVSGMKYSTEKDTDWQFTRDQTCRD